jgi:NAD(P)-dependent dehydrogenase (short-subunit alcohol dehydrogenase family)
MTSLFDLSGKTAIVTGSSRGIGRAIAEEMAAHGANVVISSRKQDACEEVAQAINARGQGKAVAIAASISDKEALRELALRTNTEFGQIDILVCNAASNPYYGPMGGITDDSSARSWTITSCPTTG